MFFIQKITSADQLPVNPHRFQSTILFFKLVLLSMLLISLCVLSDDDLLDNEVITVTSGRYLSPISSVLAPTITLTRDAIIQSQANSVLELVKRLPGISVAQSGGTGQQSSLFIRGTESRHVLVLIDGIRLNQANISGASDLSQIPLSLIQKIEYIRGARSALYGSDAIGGVINLITYPEENDDYLGSARVALGSHDTQQYDLSAQLGKGMTKVNGAIGLNRSQGTDAVANMPDAGSIRQPDKDGYQNRFAWLGIAHQFNQHLSGNIRAFGIQNRNKYDGFFSYVDPTALIDERALESSNLDGRMYWQTDRYAIQLIASHNQTKDYNYNDRNGRKDITASLDDARQNQIQLINTWRYGYGSINLGGEWQQQITEQTPSDSNTKQRSSLNNRAVYMTTQYQLEKWLVETALRHDNQSQFGDHLTYHFGVSYPILENYKVGVLYGHAYKAPNLMQLYSQYGGNINLKPEQSKQAEINLEGEFEQFSFRVTAYKNNITELIDYQTEQFINIGRAEISGGELEFKLESDYADQVLTLAYLNAKDKNKGNRLVRRAPKQLDYQLTKVIDRTEVTLNYHVEDKREDMTFDNDSFTNKKVTLPINQQFDLALSHEITPSFIIRGRISDIFNQQRETVYGYQPTGRSFSIGGEYKF
ncbi:TonB-dependent receptor domain-containing protein [Thorsellia anophelis]|uniref:Vitamin B12 transporter n=1 Tax=Thorsellia anophelis DSM 18579 TaxID=1123402 RepID=A0A1I0E361_9GAMM|nr:TonB-dependent receptor [Thorsellia anophelis]SET39530.1 vitamin B12 transporter [Thorsellia anophelis DSM 18579]